MLYIGVDLGTSAVKAAYLWNGNGEIANIASKEYPLYLSTTGLVVNRSLRTGGKSCVRVVSKELASRIMTHPR